jgi:hypothetical protein
MDQFHLVSVHQIANHLFLLKIKISGTVQSKVVKATCSRLACGLQPCAEGPMWPGHTSVRYKIWFQGTVTDIVLSLFRILFTHVSYLYRCFVLHHCLQHCHQLCHHCTNNENNKKMHVNGQFRSVSIIQENVDSYRMQSRCSLLIFDQFTLLLSYYLWIYLFHVCCSRNS